MAKQPSQDIQGEALGIVIQTFEDYRTLLQNYRTTWFDLHQATYVFQTKRQGLGKSTAFFPKCYENLQRVSPRIYGNRPKFVLSMVAPIPDISPAEGPGMIEQQQKALNYFWKMSGCEKKARTLVDAGLVYGTAFAKSSIQQKLKKLKTEKTKNVKGVEKVTVVETEEVVTEYPTFEVPDIFDMYFDPRIESERDYPSIIENMDNVRIADILANTEKYFNLDMVANANSAAYSSSGDNKKLQKFQAEGISQDYTGQTGRGNLKEFYGYFSETGKIEDEKFVKITVFNDSFVIGYEEVDCHPYIKFNPVEIPNQGCGLGIVEPIKQLQDVYNLTRNQRLENVSMVINRMWLMKQGAGLDPRTLQSRAGNVIMTKDMDAIKPLDTPDVTASSYNETQALNTEIQGILGTIDTTQDAGDNGFTNLATGQKIRWNEFNSRFKAIKENFEEALSKVGQKMLRTVAKEAAFDPIIEDEVTQRFFKMARESFNTASDFYSVSVLADSTASDSIENQRDESLAFGQLAIAYKAQGLNIPLEVVWKDIVASYPGKNPDEYILPPPPPQPEQGQPGAQAENEAEEATEGAEVQAGSQEEGEMLNDSLIPQTGPMGEDSAEALNEQLTKV